ncbi:hypothetical protein [Pseudescherichia sp.]|uniref:hypothetical protein n=1 Tax=Pseudescherichia sp. TaxID=2055881 RepID=UPI002897C1F7|nr:hypothetical protein [Pseudescherichia sp.]
MYKDFRFIALIFIFIGLAISLVIYFRFYRKYSRQLSDVFSQLQKERYLDVEDYRLYEQLGAPGFVHRVNLMRKILQCKPLKRSKGRWLEPDAGKLMLSLYDFSWIGKFHKLSYFVAILMFLLVVLAMTGK